MATAAHAAHSRATCSHVPALDPLEMVRAIATAREGDVVLIAGKGHETYQEIAGVRLPFSDAEVARGVLNEQDGAVGRQRDGAALALRIDVDFAVGLRRGVPLMLYVFSDGSLDSNGMIDNSVEGRGKGVWTGDNQSTACSFFLVYNPTGRPALFTGDSNPAERHQQPGWTDESSVHDSS